MDEVVLVLCARAFPFGLVGAGGGAPRPREAWEEVERVEKVGGAGGGGEGPTVSSELERSCGSRGAPGRRGVGGELGGSICRAATSQRWWKRKRVDLSARIALRPSRELDPARVPLPACFLKARPVPVSFVSLNAAP